VIILHTQQSDENSNDRHVKNKKLRALLRVCKRFGKAWLMSSGTSADPVTPRSPPELCALGPEDTPDSSYFRIMGWREKTH
jgi:hypothetical protein